MYGYDFEVLAYRFDEPNASDQEINAAVVIVERFMRPAPEGTIKQELARLRVSTKARADDEGNTAMGFQVFAEECAGYPEDVVIWALRSWARIETFYPSLAEIRDRLQRGVRRRQSLLRALRNV